MLKPTRPLLFFSIFFVAGLIVLVVMGRDEFQLFVNRKLTGWTSDQIFGKITLLGNGFTVAAVVLWLFLHSSLRKGLAVGISAISAAMVVQTMKQVFFIHSHRPIKYFHDMGIQDLHWPIGTEVLFTYSFPSGHTATAFTLYFFFIFTTRKVGIQLVWFFVAILVGYSRIHLSQHFLTDVLAGSAIGFILAYLAAKWFLKGVNPRLERRILPKKRLVE